MRTIGLVLSVVVLVGSPALAADKTKPPAPPQMTKEQRNKMADAHEKMAACLRSNRELKDCHDEMMRACKDAMGPEGCPMMGPGHMQHGGQPPKGQTP